MKIFWTLFAILAIAAVGITLSLASLALKLWILRLVTG